MCSHPTALLGICMGRLYEFGKRDLKSLSPKWSQQQRSCTPCLTCHAAPCRLARTGNDRLSGWAGLSITGHGEPARLLRKGGLRHGQALILTKPLGTGVLMAAGMRRKAKGRWVTAACASMLQSNAAAASCLAQHGATGCTDVTGFGLLGHLAEMARASQVRKLTHMRAIARIPMQFKIQKFELGAFLSCQTG